MTYDQWFRSQQEIPYEGMFLFAEAAWGHQQQRIESLENALRTCKREFGDIINHAHKDYLVIDWARDAIKAIDNKMEEEE